MHLARPRLPRRGQGPRLSGPRLAGYGEARLLARLGRLLGRPWRPGRAAGATHALGVGDDAAVVPGHGGRGGYCVACCDLLVEDVDFRRRWARFADVGHKAAAANLSDLAAMGARPTGLLLGLALAPDERVADVLALVRGVHALGRAHGAPLVGGDLSATRGPLVVSVTALGALLGRAPLRRGRGRLGDDVVVFGTLGAARAGLALLEARAAVPRWARALVRRQCRPRPQVDLGRALAGLAGVHAVVDVSDGLTADAGHLVAAPLGVTLAARALPLAAGVARAATLLHGDAAAATALRWAASGGEDYVLAAAVARGATAQVREAARAVGARAYVVGRVTRSVGVRLVDRSGLEVHVGAGAYEHFGQA